MGTQTSQFEEASALKRLKVKQRKARVQSHELAEENHRLGIAANARVTVVDIELTNRCNASCNFCPREKTPHQGRMSEATLDMTISRIEEFSDALIKNQPDCPVKVSFCGLGEPCLHPSLAASIARVTEAGFSTGLASNGSLLTPELTDELLAAGLTSIYFNVGELGKDYEQVYGLEFAKTLENIEHFRDKAEGKCHVFIVIPDHRMDPQHCKRVKDFWRDHGITLFFNSPVINRAGAKPVEGLPFEPTPQTNAQTKAIGDLFEGDLPGCIAPMLHTFISYDGTYYLCNSDWEREAPVGTIFKRSIVDSMREKLTMTGNRENTICWKCNHDPLNQVLRMQASDASAHEQSEAASLLSNYYTESIRFVESCSKA